MAFVHSQGSFINRILIKVPNLVTCAMTPSVSAQVEVQVDDVLPALNHEKESRKDREKTEKEREGERMPDTPRLPGLISSFQSLPIFPHVFKELGIKHSLY